MNIFGELLCKIHYQLVQKYEDISLHSSSLRFFYANLRIIHTVGKFDEIHCILRATPKTTHLLIFTETWITSDSDAKLYNIQNYKHVYNYRKNMKDGGVSIYVHDSIKYEITEELCENRNHFLWISIDKLSLNIGAIYKPGDTSINNFMNIDSSQLEKRRRTLVFGDFNIDLLSKNSYTSQYLHDLKENGYEILNKIDRTYSMRVTSTTNTILDHIASNIDNHFFSISIIESSLSDHNQLYLEVHRLPSPINKKNRYKALDYEKLYNTTLKDRKITKTKKISIIILITTSHD